MSVLTKLPVEFYERNRSAFDRFSAGCDFHLGAAKGMAWLSQLAYETDEPEKIRGVLRGWGLDLIGEVISREIATVLPTASTHAFVAAGRGATFVHSRAPTPSSWRTGSPTSTRT